MKSEKIYTELYAITFKESGAILTPDSFKKFWKSYGDNGLYGWRAPKKIYYTLGMAKAGFSHMPEQIKPLVQISKFVLGESVVDGQELFNKQKAEKEKREAERKELALKREIEYAEIKMKEAQENLKRLKSK